MPDKDDAAALFLTGGFQLKKQRCFCYGNKNGFKKGRSGHGLVISISIRAGIRPNPFFTMVNR
jgi:hypothetical protein